MIILIYLRLRKMVLEREQKYQNTELEYPVVVALRELALEEVRREKYPDYPSRMECLYVSETLQEATRWAEYFMSLSRPTFQIVKLKITGSRFIGDATKCFDTTIYKMDNLSLAEKYWNNAGNAVGQPPIKEYLVGGDIEVVEIIKSYV